VKNRLLKIDLHVHTHYSEDATTTLNEVVYYAKKRGLDGLAVTDHETLEGAKKLEKRRPNLTIIPGLEIETPSGHILALNVTTVIPSKLSILETVEKIHEVGGTAVLAHPAAVLKIGLGQKMRSDSNIDAVEVINSGTFPFFLSTYLGCRIAERFNLPRIAGSDAHHPSEIGAAYTIVDAESNSDDIAGAIRKGVVTPYGKPIKWAERIQRGAFYLAKIRRRRYSSKFSI
jgi:predicted metal-dependent phosphoesterase TrpH